ncbi:hypothetical protein E2562_021916 [Oryza meyeriana var. granulata]|uniref:Uncharacterized protein n=1 Tax=Oryza meyeriana var. granulata TaxID=110450 RepID=A0A6G1C8D3_9ORYZ|nr:hypothetical protein E2562_021916 [Oryza meyeriana var. granulata]
MAHDAEARRSSWPHDGEASGGLGPGARETGPKAWPMPGEGDIRNPPTWKKKKMTPTHERLPFVSSPWGFTAPRPRQPKEVGPAVGPEALSSLMVGEAEAVAVPPEANLPPRRG